MEVTTQATDFLRHRLESANIPPEQGPRLKYDGNNWGLQTDECHEGDTVYRDDDDNRVILLVPETIRRALANKKMDVRETEQGPSLYIE